MAGSLPKSGISLVAEGVGSFLSDVGRAQKGVLGFGDATKGIGGSFSGLREIAVGALREIGAMATQALAEAGRAAAGFVKDSISTAGDFEQTLSVIGATSGATADELKAVGDRAKELGADLSLPATSANEAAEVMLELSKAGMTVQESMDAAKGALQLAAAAQTDGATAADIMSGALNAFELEATDAVRVADLLAAGANASSASMTDLGQGLQQAGFAFNAAGLPVEDLVTALAQLTNVGLTGSDAGTALKNALMRLMNPTAKASNLMEELGIDVYDANGQMKQLPEIIAVLNTALGGMTDEERNAALGTIFLSDGMKAMIPLLDLGTAGFATLKGAVTEQGAASDVAAAQMQGWNGAIASITSQMETFQLVIGQQLLPLLTPLAFKVAELVGGFTALTEKFLTMLPTIQSSAEPFRALMAALVILNPSLIGVTGLLLSLADTFGPVISMLLHAGPLSIEFSEALGALLGPLGVTTGAIQTGQQALADIGAALQTVGGILVGAFSSALTSSGVTAGGLATVFLTVVLPAIATIAEWVASNLPAAIAIGQAAFANIAAFIGSVMPSIQGIVESVLTIIGALWQQHGATILAVASGAWQAIQGAIQVVLGIIQAAFAVFAAALTGDYETMHQQIAQAQQTAGQGLQNLWNGLSTALGTIVQNLFALILSQAETKLNEMVSQAHRAVGMILDAWASQYTAFTSVGAGIIDGIKSGIEGAIGGLVDQAAEAARAALNAAKSALGISSPSRVFALEVGKPITQGIAQGILRNAGLVSGAVGAVTSPAAMPGAAAFAGNVTNTTTTSYTMPIYTNQSPAVLQQSLAVVQALST